MVQQGLLDEPVFAFYLGDKKDGQLTFGGTDKSHYKGELEYVTSATYWSVKLDAVETNGEKLTDVDKAIVDSSTSPIAGPGGRAGRARAHKFIMGEYLISCTAAAPDISSVLGKSSTKDEYTHKSGPLCLFAFTGIDIPARSGSWATSSCAQAQSSLPSSSAAKVVAAAMRQEPTANMADELLQRWPPAADTTLSLRSSGKPSDFHQRTGDHTLKRKSFSDWLRPTMLRRGAQQGAPSSGVTFVLIVFAAKVFESALARVAPTSN